MSEGPHPFPSRTRKLSPLEPMVLHGRLCGRVGSCRNPFEPCHANRGRALFFSKKISWGRETNDDPVEHDIPLEKCWLNHLSRIGKPLNCDTFDDVPLLRGGSKWGGDSGRRSVYFTANNALQRRSSRMRYHFCSDSRRSGGAYNNHSRHRP